MAKLIGIGFDEPTARHLASRFAAEAIERQIEWLPQRKADTNRLGLLRRAIEGNWSQPEASTFPPEHAAGALFVRHFEAALHGYTDPPSGCTPKEAEMGARFLRELAATGASEAEAAEWGRRFGQFVRAKSPPKPWFVWVLRVYGGEFLRQCRQAIRRDEKLSAAQARRAHEEKFTPRYQDYLRAEEVRLRGEDPGLYAAFEAHRQEVHARFRLSAKTCELLTSEASRLSAFGDFLRERSIPLLDFWAWDQQFNAQRCVSRHD